MGLAHDSASQAEGEHRFDAQAATFDRRAGLPPPAAVAIADGVLAVTSCHGRSQSVLELGAGTGEMGRYLAARASRYVGIDLSWPMLGVFRSKPPAGSTAPALPLLVQADADRHWPVRDGSVTVVFASRVAHLLDTGHVVSEAARVCVRPGFLVVGRVERTGIKQLLRRQREVMLAERGIAAGRPGRRRTQALLEALVAAGAVSEPTRTVATWPVTTTTEEVISAWDTMSTMGGQAVAPDTRAELLGELRHWARDHIGDPDRPQSSAEHYTLECARLG